MSLHWTGLETEVRNLLASAVDHAYVFAPFIQPEMLRRILPVGTTATIVTSWKAEHLISGVSSISLYEECRRRGGTALYIHPRIHLKLYGKDVTRSDNDVLTGSANVTAPGLGDDASANLEVLTRVRGLTVCDRVAIQRIIAESTRVDDSLYKQFAKWIQETEPSTPMQTLPPPPETAGNRNHLVTDLPLTNDPRRVWSLAVGDANDVQWWEEDAMVHDLAHYGGDLGSGEDEFLRATAEKFFTHPFVGAFIASLAADGKFFGAIKEWIQSNCDDVPTPKRRDLTETVQALMQWCVTLASDRFEIVRPNFSECLRFRRQAETEEE